MPVEVFFAPAENARSLTVAQLTTELTSAGLKPCVVNDKAGQIWIEFYERRSRLLLGEHEPLTLVILQVYDSVDDGSDLELAIATILSRFGYVDAEQLGA